MTVKIKQIYPYILIVSSILILITRCFYSFCWSDETFYFSTCHRFYTGDSIFVHEWFPTQLSSVAVLPLYSLYMTVTGSNTGIILYFRILFVVMSTVNALILYNILKQSVTEFSALAASLALMYYTHLNIATVSYYTMSLQFFTMSMALIYHYYRSLNTRHLIYSGIFFALSVLSLPTLCAAYFLVVFMILLLLLYARIKGDKGILSNIIGEARLNDILVCTFAGILIPAVLFFIYMLRTVSIPDFIKAIPYVLSDEEHGTSLIYPIKKMYISINEVFGYGAYASYLMIAVTAVASLFGISENKRFRIFIFSADIVLFAELFTCALGHIGYIQTALLLFAMPLFFMQKKKDIRAFILFVVSGMIFSLVYSYSSNGYLYVLSMGHFVASIGCIMIIDGFMYEILSSFVEKEHEPLTGKIIGACCTAVILVFVLQSMILRLTNVYRDASVDLLTSRITEGPGAGLLTTPEHLDSYNRVYETIKNYCMSANLEHPSEYPNSMELGSQKVGNIFITKLLPWGYMCTDLRCAAPTTWRTSFNSVRLEPYYEMNPGRYPDMILVLDDEYGSYLTCGDVEADPVPNENEIGGYLLERVTEDGYDKISVPCGTLYVRPGVRAGR